MRIFRRVICFDKETLDITEDQASRDKLSFNDEVIYAIRRALLTKDAGIEVINADRASERLGIDKTNILRWGDNGSIKRYKFQSSPKLYFAVDELHEMAKTIKHHNKIPENQIDYQRSIEDLEQQKNKTDRMAEILEAIERFIDNGKEAK